MNRVTECRLDGRRRPGSVPSQCCSRDEPAGDHSRISNSSGSSMLRLTAPSRALRLVLIAGVLPALAFGLAACDNGGGINGDDNSPPNASVTANTTDPVVGDTVELDASKSDDPDGDELKFSWTLETPEGSNATLSSPTTARPWYVPDTSGDYRAEVAVGDSKLSDTDDVSMEALEKLPETVTVLFENVAADGDTLVTGTVTWEDSVVAEDVRSAEVTIPASRNAGELCTEESELFNEGCISVTPTSDISEVREISVQRKSVEFTVIPDPPYGDPAETDVTVYEPNHSDSTKFTGEGTVELAKRKAGLHRQVVTDLITDDPDKDGSLDRLISDTTVAANSNVDLTVEPEKLLACSDGIDSDGNGSVDADDLGCSDDAGTGYDPEDDNETYYLFRRSAAVYFDDSTYVSGHPDERTVEIVESDFPESITVAIGEVRFWIENKRLADTSKQHFRMRVLSGPDHGDYTASQESEVVADPDTASGFRILRVHGLTRFEGGRWYKLVAKKAEPFGGLENQAIFFAENANVRQHFWEYFFEKDHPKLNDGKSQVLGINAATLKNGQCRSTAKGEICKNLGDRMPPWQK